MIYFRDILFLIISTIFCGDIDVLYATEETKDTVNRKAILIPDYNSDKSNFDLEYLGKTRKIFYYSNVSYINENNAINFSFSPFFNYKNFKLKIDLEYFLNLEDSNSLANDWSSIGFIEKIDYLELRLFNERINLFLGEISDLSFGYGYLLNRYGNNYNYPVDRNVGLQLRIKNLNNSISYTSFISNLDHFSRSGGLIGNYISFLVSDSFPLRLGFGHIIDSDQFVDHKDYIDKSRKISAFEVDFDFPIFNILNRNVLLIGEISAIKFPETRYML